MNKKKVFTILLVAVLAVLFVGSIYFLGKMPSSRDATEEEIQGHSVYKVDWSAVPGAQANAGEKAIILSLCTPAENTEEGSAAQLYTSETLGNYLYHFSGSLEISMTDGALSVFYQDTDSCYVFFTYDDTGLTQFAVHNPATDTMYYENDGTACIATKINSSLMG